MKILIVHQTIAKHDAIGNDIYHMYQALNPVYECYVHCDYLQNENLRLIDRQKLDDFISDSDNLVIYHHSQFWEEGERILCNSSAKKMFKYHNITPSSFFEGCCDDAYCKCSAGRQQTARLASDYNNVVWMGDSLFNLMDIDAVPAGNKIVVPPFNNMSQWLKTVPDEQALRVLLANGVINLLFVGRVVPNKGHKFLLRVLRDYIDNYSDKIKLHLIGRRYDDFRKYNEEIDADIKMLGLEKHVEFIGEITDSIALTYYLGSDFLVCASEHEGFCLPLIEAQFAHLPVIARRSSAVGETLGENQVVLAENIHEYSAALHILNANREYRKFLIDKGYENYAARFDNDKIKIQFQKAVERAIN